MQSKKIAIFHNYLDNIGGAEMVCLTLAREFNADIYTTNIDYEKIKKMGFEKIIPKIFSIGKVPLKEPFKRQFALFKLKHLNLKNRYDFYIIGGDWALSAAINHHPNLWYIHSPIREIYDAYNYTRTEIISCYQRPIFDAWVKYNRHLNKKYTNYVDNFVCNSKNTQKRIKKFLNKNAKIIYPPVNTKEFHYKKSSNFWLSVNRLLKPKRVEIQMHAFKHLPKEKLIIVGSYEQSFHFLKYVEYLKSIKPSNVEIKSWASREELIRLYSSCKGFITTALDEDFGITPVEAMASGKPVIAANEGGYKETIINNKTGILIDNMDETKLISAIKLIGKKPQKYKSSCLTQAKKFDTRVFISQIKEIIYNYSEQL